MRIAILVTNTDDSAFAARHDPDAVKFAKLLAPVAPGWSFPAFQVKDGDFPETPEAFDGFIVTGSPASVNGSAPWIARLMGLLRDLHAQKRPVFGACFGHQALAMALGGTVEDNPGGWVFGLTETTMEGAPLRLYAAHSEQVTALPPGAVNLGGNDACPIGSFAIGGHILTTQYHPEITAGFMAGLVQEYGPKLPPDVAAGAAASLARSAETDRIARRIVAFFQAA